MHTVTRPVQPPHQAKPIHHPEGWRHVDTQNEKAEPEFRLFALNDGGR